MKKLHVKSNVNDTRYERIGRQKIERMSHKSHKRWLDIFLLSTVFTFLETFFLPRYDFCTRFKLARVKITLDA